jgi:hypothetical protein
MNTLPVVYRAIPPSFNDIGQGSRFLNGRIIDAPFHGHEAACIHNCVFYLPRRGGVRALAARRTAGGGETAGIAGFPGIAAARRAGEARDSASAGRESGWTKKQTNVR